MGFFRRIKDFFKKSKTTIEFSQDIEDQIRAWVIKEFRGETFKDKDGWDVTYSCNLYWDKENKQYVFAKNITINGYVSIFIYKIPELTYWNWIHHILN